MKKIAAKEFKELYQTSEIAVLDVREKGEFQSGAKILRHLPRWDAFSKGLSIFGRKRL